MSQIIGRPSASLSHPQNKIYHPKNLQQPNPTGQFRQEIMSAFVLVGFIAAALVVFALMRSTPSGQDVKESARKEKIGLPEQGTPEPVQTTSNKKSPKARAGAEGLPMDRDAADVATTEVPPETTDIVMKVPSRPKGGPTKVYHAPRDIDEERSDDS